MSYIVASKAAKSLVNKIKFREERIAQCYREIHDMVLELEEYMGNATGLIYKHRLILKRNANSGILPIEIDVFSEAITYCYHEIIEKQLESINQRKQRIRELKHEIEELVKENEVLRRNKQYLKAQIEKNNLQENNIGKTRYYLIASMAFTVLLIIALLFTATLRESFVVLLFSGLTAVNFVWSVILAFERQSLNHQKDELTEKEFMFNKSVQTFENERLLFEQEKLRLRGINETTVKTVNEKLQIARQQKEKYLAQEKQYQEAIAQLNEKIAILKEKIINGQAQILELQKKAESLEKEIQERQNEIDSYKEQIEAGEHVKRKADNLELDYRRLFVEYHNRDSEIQELKTDLNNSASENKRLSQKILSLEADCETIRKEHENCQKEKQELERKCQYLSSRNESLENQNKGFQRQHEDSQNNYSELEIEFKRIQAENQEFERKVQKLNSQISLLNSRNEELQSQLKTVLSKYSDLDKRIEIVQKEKQELENEKRILKSQKKLLESEKEELQKLNNDLQSKNTCLNDNLERVLEENQTLKDINDRLASQISSLKIENEELLAENSDYVLENSKFKVQIQNLQEECLSLRTEKLNNYNSNKKDYLDLQARFNALQKENEELRYNLLKLDSMKAQEIIRRNSSNDELDDSLQSVPAEIDSATLTNDNSANSEQDLFFAIADEIIKKSSYSEEELIALYRRFNMSIFSGNAKINSWTDDVFGDELIFEENKCFVINPEIAAKVRNREVEDE